MAWRSLSSRGKSTEEEQRELQREQREQVAGERDIGEVNLWWISLYKMKSYKKSGGFVLSFIYFFIFFTKCDVFYLDLLNKRNKNHQTLMSKLFIYSRGEEIKPWDCRRWFIQAYLAGWWQSWASMLSVHCFCFWGLLSDISYWWHSTFRKRKLKPF